MPARMPGVEGGSYGWAAIDAINNSEAMVDIAAETTLVDEGIGKVLAALQQGGFDDDTLVVFSSDQGSAYGQLGLWGNSSWGAPFPAYNANMQIPLIVRHPGRVPAMRRSTLMVNQFDLLPTLLDYLGLADRDTANSPGKSFASLLQGGSLQRWDDAVFFEYITTRVVQTRTRKYIKRFLDSPDELFDLEIDPGETRNLIDEPDYAADLANLNRRLENFFDRYADPEYDVWKGGTAKATLIYGDRNKRFEDRFPDWQAPSIHKAKRFRDRKAN